MGLVLIAVGRKLHRFAEYLAALIAMLRRRQDFILERHPGAQDLADAKRVAVFAHYDRGGQVHDYVIQHLASLQSAGFSTIFISNSPRFEPAALRKVRPLCAVAVHRRNVGYDFGAYKDGLAIIGDWSALDELILANDSVYGPFQNLADVLARCDDSADVWGMTDNQELRYHLQSYFLLFTKRAIVNSCMAEFWDLVLPVQSREWVIRRYEIGLTQAMRRASLRCAALFPSRAVMAGEPGDRLNVMHHRWQEIIRMGCPFIKRELLATNPKRIADIDRWREVIGSVSSYNTDLIARHLDALGHAWPDDIRPWRGLCYRRRTRTIPIATTKPVTHDRG